MSDEPSRADMLNSAGVNGPVLDDSFMDFSDHSPTEMDLSALASVNGTTSLSSSAFVATVSPNDLSLPRDSFAPARPTYESPYLTTPSLLDDDSPFLTDSLDVSPSFECADFESSGYAPLFPTAAEHGSIVSDCRPQSHQAAKVNPLGPVSGYNLAMSRSKSTRNLNDDDSAQRDLLRQRLSLTAGIAKSSVRQTKVLNPIEVDSGDEKASKRAKNTMAARKSRQKKKDEVAQLEAQLLIMMDERDYWKMLAIKHGAPIPDSPAMSPAS